MYYATLLMPEDGSSSNCLSTIRTSISIGNRRSVESHARNERVKLEKKAERLRDCKQSRATAK